jgi:hypothetical protein
MTEKRIFGFYKTIKVQSFSYERLNGSLFRYRFNLPIGPFCGFITVFGGGAASYDSAQRYYYSTSQLLMSLFLSSPP